MPCLTLPCCALPACPGPPLQVRNALCNSLLIDPADMGVEDVLALHGAAHLPRGSAAALDHHARRLIADHSLEVGRPLPAVRGAPLLLSLPAGGQLQG